MGNFRYLSYLIRHKWFVFVAGLRVGVSWWRLFVHDWSKFLPCEWFPYARFFYGGRSLDHTHSDGYSCSQCDEIRERFDFAWLHHQKLNPHHWQYWILREDSGATKLMPIPEKFIREMVADWMGAGRAITGKWEARAWYEKNKERILLNEITRKRVEELLPEPRVSAD